MSRFALTLLVLLVLITGSQAQNPVRYPHHAIYGELFGPYLTLTPTYQYHFLHQSRFTVSAQVGFPVALSYEGADAYASTSDPEFAPSILLGLGTSLKLNDQHALEVSSYIGFRNPVFRKLGSYKKPVNGVSLNYVYRIPASGYLLKAGFTVYPVNPNSHRVFWSALPQLAFGHEIGGTQARPRSAQPTRLFRLVSVGLNVGYNRPLIFGNFIANPGNGYTVDDLYYTSVSTKGNLAAGLNVNLALGRQSTLRVGAQYMSGSLLLDFQAKISSGADQTLYFYRSVRQFKQVQIPVAFQYDLDRKSGCYVYGGGFFSKIYALNHTGFDLIQSENIWIKPDVNFHSPTANFGPMVGFGTRFNILGVSLNVESEYKISMLKDVNGMFRQQSFNGRIGLELNFPERE
ncbi:MAG: hypothetical protein H6581_10655 [Bacteroidia bacterium]|nr:hypothetical protein [Bacteroidia bacterium]